RPEALRVRFQLASGPCAESERSGQNHSPAEEQSRMRSEDFGEPDHRPAKAPFDTARYWVQFAPGTPGYRVFAKQMKNPPIACGLANKSTINKRATTKSVKD